MYVPDQFYEKMFNFTDFCMQNYLHNDFTHELLPRFIDIIPFNRCHIGAMDAQGNSMFPLSLGPLDIDSAYKPVEHDDPWRPENTPLPGGISCTYFGHRTMEHLNKTNPFWNHLSGIVPHRAVGAVMHPAARGLTCIIFDDHQHTDYEQYFFSHTAKILLNHYVQREKHFYYEIVIKSIKEENFMAAPHIAVFAKNGMPLNYNFRPCVPLAAYKEINAIITNDQDFHQLVNKVELTGMPDAKIYSLEDNKGATYRCLFYCALYDGECYILITIKGIEKCPMQKLTVREKAIAELMYEGLTNRCISEHLSISVETVKKHLSNIFKKLNITNRTELAKLALKFASTRPNIYTR